MKRLNDVISIVYGLKALDTVTSRLEKFNAILITPFKGSFRIYREISLSNGTFKHYILSLIMKFFRISSEEYSTIRDVLCRSNMLCDVINELYEYNYNDVKFKYLIDILVELCSQDTENGYENYIRTWCSEPFQTFLSLIALYYLCEVKNVNKPVLCVVNNVNGVVDLLLMFRNKNVYVFTLEKPNSIDFFDEVYIHRISTVSREHSGVIRIRNGEVVRCKIPDFEMKYEDLKIPLSKYALDSISVEILQILSELGFMTLHSLRESVSNQFGIDKSEVDRRILKLWRCGLVDIRYLPDGRVVILPTLTGLVKAKDFSGNSLRTES